jgi:hypothetical protein
MGWVDRRNRAVQWRESDRSRLPDEMMKELLYIYLVCTGSLSADAE